MSKFKSLVLFSFLCVGSQVGFSSEDFERSSQTVSFDENIEDAAVSSVKKQKLIAIFEEFEADVDRLQQASPILASLCSEIHGNLEPIKKGLEGLGILADNTPEWFRKTLGLLEIKLIRNALNRYTQKRQTLEKGGHVLQRFIGEDQRFRTLQNQIENLRELHNSVSIRDISEIIKHTELLDSKITNLAKNIAIDALETFDYGLVLLREMVGDGRCDFLYEETVELRTYLEGGGEIDVEGISQRFEKGIVAPITGVGAFVNMIKPGAISSVATLLERWGLPSAERKF